MTLPSDDPDVFPSTASAMGGRISPNDFQVLHLTGRFQGMFLVTRAAAATPTQVQNSEDSGDLIWNGP
jgi:hypothetical protein